MKNESCSLCGTPHVDPWSGRMGAFGYGIIHSNPATIKLHSISTLLSLKNTQWHQTGLQSNRWSSQYIRLLNHIFLTSLESSAFSKYTKANPRERRDCWSYTMLTSLNGPYLEKTSLRSLSVVYRLKPNTPRQLLGSGLACENKKENKH